MKNNVQSKIINKIAVVCIIILLSPDHLLARDYMKPKGGKPQAILVMLRSESNKIKYFTDRKDSTRLNWALDDAANVAQATVNDFNKNFDFCPVYFFIDTDLHYVKEKQFKNVVFACSEFKDRKFIEKFNYQNYWIIFYGKPETMYKVRAHAKHCNAADSKDQASKYDIRTTSLFQTEIAEPWGEGLIINDWRFDQIGYLCQKVVKGGPLKSYIAYRSDHFDIEYVNFAQRLNWRLSGQM